MESPDGTQLHERPGGDAGIWVDLFVFGVQTARTVTLVDMSLGYRHSSLHPDPAKPGDHVDSLPDSGEAVIYFNHKYSLQFIAKRVS